MINKIDFFIYRLKVTFYLLKEAKIGIIDAFKYSESFLDFWIEGEEPDDAVAIEMSYWEA